MNKLVCDNCGEPGIQGCPIGSMYNDSIIYPDFCTPCYEAITTGNFTWFAERNVPEPVDMQEEP